MLRRALQVLGVGVALLMMAPGAGALDFTPHGTQPGLINSTESGENCAGCHDGVGADRTRLPYTPWSGSMMANATRDPMFWAALDIANRDMPGVGDFCLRCHTPDAWLAGRVVKDGAGGTVDGANGCALQGDLDDRDSKVNDFGGVGCYVCHRTKASGPLGEPPILHNANLWIDDSLSCNGFGPCRHGPYSYPSSTPTGTINAPPHAWKHEPYFSESAFCGSCHTVDSPDTDEGPLRTLILNDGTDTGQPFPLDRTFNEWKASGFTDVLLRDGMENNDGQALAGGLPKRGDTCQTCHMRNSTSPDARACVFTPAGSRQNDLAVHEFAGSNYWMVDVLKAEYGGPSQLDREAAFDQTRAWIVENLTQRAADLEVQLGNLGTGNTTLNASVKVTNKTGHKLPNGYAEGRRMWLNVQAFDADGAVIFESGAYDPATAVLTADPQLKVYEAQHGVWERFGQAGQCVVAEPVSGRKHFNMVLNNCIAKDNRIPPVGFTGGNVPDLRPVGYVYPETSPGSGILVNHDTTQYAIPVSASAVRPIQVRVTLRFQVTTREYIEFLRDEAQSSGIPSEDQMCNRVAKVGPMSRTRGQYMYELWQKHDKAAPLDMVTLTVATPVPNDER